MSFLIVLGILGIYGSAKIYENFTRNTHVRTPEENEKLMLQMVGKSKRDAKKSFAVHTSQLKIMKNPHPIPLFLHTRKMK